MVGKGGYLVTNAHVVAGAKAVVVAFDGDRPSDAAVVLFDPKLDIAVLRAPAVKAPALAFATSDPPRGTVGAALGHPGGAPLRVIPAAVTDSYSAEGRDLYGTDRVIRRIVELRADIERGDSGGPLVLPDGTVGGVVYAEALSDPSVGLCARAGRRRQPDPTGDRCDRDRPDRRLHAMTATGPIVGPAAAKLVAELADEAWQGTLASDPTYATTLGDRRFDDRLADNDAAAHARERARLTELSSGPARSAGRPALLRRMR